jgi:DNA processing protein
MKDSVELSGARLEISQEDPRYPQDFDRVEQPPKRIFLRGEQTLLSQSGLAIVGARKATPYGLSCAKHFARLAALRGIVVVSGGAIGCDQAAHRGALEVGGKTIVVLGCGADVIYPSRASELFEQVLQGGGLMISEAPWGSPPSRWGFRRRNRLIAGIAQATLIVEAGVPSGTFSTADATLSQGKEVLAIPGSIFAKESRGSNRLIAQGAVPIVDDETFNDALVQIFGLPAIDASRATEPEQDLESATGDGIQIRVLSALTQEPRHAEELLGICGDSIIEVIRYLSALELNGLVTRLRDGRYASARTTE